MNPEVSNGGERVDNPFEELASYASYEDYRAEIDRRMEEAEKAKREAEEKIAEANKAKEVTVDDWNYRKWLQNNENRSEEQRRAEEDSFVGEKNINSATGHERNFSPADLYPHMKGENNEAYSERWAKMSDLPKDADGAIDLEKVATMRREAANKEVAMGMMGKEQATARDFVEYEMSLKRRVAETEKEIAEMRGRHADPAVIAEASADLASMNAKLGKVSNYLGILAKETKKEEWYQSPSEEKKEPIEIVIPEREHYERPQDRDKREAWERSAQETMQAGRETEAENGTDNKLNAVTNLTPIQTKALKVERKSGRKWGGRVKALAAGVLIMLSLCGCADNNKNAVATAPETTADADTTPTDPEKDDLTLPDGREVVILGEEEKQADDSVERFVIDGSKLEHMENGLAYCLDDYKDFEHKVTHEAFGTSRVEFFKNEKGSVESILNDCTKMPSVLASHVSKSPKILMAAGFNEADAKSMTYDKLMDALLNAANGGELQKNLLNAYEKALKGESTKSTDFSFYYEYGQENTPYLYMKNGASVESLKPGDLERGMDLKQRKGEEQLRIRFVYDDGAVEELDLNHNCGWQNNEIVDQTTDITERPEEPEEKPVNPGEEPVDPGGTPEEIPEEVPEETPGTTEEQETGETPEEEPEAKSEEALIANSGVVDTGTVPLTAEEEKVTEEKEGVKDATPTATQTGDKTFVERLSEIPQIFHDEEKQEENRSNFDADATFGTGAVETTNPDVVDQTGKTIQERTENAVKNGLGEQFA